MIILSLDFETTGLDRNADRVTEVGAVLYSTNHQQTLMSKAYLVDNEVSITKEITALTGISKNMIDKFGLHSKTALADLLYMVSECEAIVGQNILDFDMPFLENWCSRESETLPPRLVIDTKLDLPGVESKHLGYMAADEGFVNPFPHRALSDCLTVLKLISLHDGKRKPTTFEDILARARSSRLTIAANVTKANNDQARKRGFRWSPERTVWHKTIREIDLDRIVKEAPFDICKIEPIPFH